MFYKVIVFFLVVIVTGCSAIFTDRRWVGGNAPNSFLVRSPRALIVNVTNELTKAKIGYSLNVSNTVVSIRFKKHFVTGLMSINCDSFEFTDVGFSSVTGGFHLTGSFFSSEKDFNYVWETIRRAEELSNWDDAHCTLYLRGKWSPTNELYLRPLPERKP
jgi:hypothetical protein